MNVGGTLPNSNTMTEEMLVAPPATVFKQQTILILYPGGNTLATFLPPSALRSHSGPSALGWDAAVQRIRQSDQLRNEIIESVRTSFEVEGFHFTWEEATQSMERALIGPPLEFVRAR